MDLGSAVLRGRHVDRQLLGPGFFVFVKFTAHCERRAAGVC
jgi:hypothetical protein